MPAKVTISAGEGRAVAPVATRRGVTITEVRPTTATGSAWTWDTAALTFDSDQWTFDGST